MAVGMGAARWQWARQLAEAQFCHCKFSPFPLCFFARLSSGRGDHGLVLANVAKKKDCWELFVSLANKRRNYSRNKTKPFTVTSILTSNYDDWSHNSHVSPMRQPASG
jgi:hypothetical protein